MPACSIFTFGRLTICRNAEEIALPTRQGDTLCKALLCQPGRQAESLWLAEQLWPEADGAQAASYLHNAAWTLRQALPEGLLLTHKATQSYQLAGQDRLWIDADAALSLIEEAHTLGRTTKEALPLLEQAVQFFRRGRFLAGMEETWVHAKRMRLETMKEHALTHLVEAYHTQGTLQLAEALLAEALAEDPTNENLLCRLMQTLHAEGMTHQALRAYETFVKALKNIDLEPAEATTDLYERLKRGPRLLDLSALSTTAPASLSSASLAAQHQENASQATDPTEPLLISAGAQNAQTVLLPLFTQAVKQGILQAAGELNYQRRSETREATSAEEGQPSSPQDIPVTKEQAARLSSLFQGGESMTFDPTKRKLLEGILAGVGFTLTAPLVALDPEPWEQLALAPLKPSVIDEAALHHFERLLGEIWALSNSNELAAAESILSSFLPRLLAIPAREVTPPVACLASHGLRLQSVLIHHRFHLPEKLLLCEMSVEYARHANDANTLVPALIALAAAYKFQGYPDKRMETLQEALLHARSASPLVQSRAYSNTASALAESGRVHEAELYITLARDVFPHEPSRDPGFALSDSHAFTLSYHAGKVYTYAGKISLAFEAFDLYKQLSPGMTIPERIRLEIVNAQSKAAIQAKDLDRYAECLECVLAGAVTLRSKKRFDEAASLFRQEAPKSWGSDSRIQQIAQTYHLAG